MHKRQLIIIKDVIYFKHYECVIRISIYMHTHTCRYMCLTIGHTEPSLTIDDVYYEKHNRHVFNFFVVLQLHNACDDL